MLKKWKYVLLGKPVVWNSFHKSRKKIAIIFTANSLKAFISSTMRSHFMTSGKLSRLYLIMMILRFTLVENWDRFFCASWQPHKECTIVMHFGFYILDSSFAGSCLLFIEENDLLFDFWFPLLDSVFPFFNRGFFTRLQISMTWLHVDSVLPLVNSGSLYRSPIPLQDSVLPSWNSGSLLDSRLC